MLQTLGIQCGVYSKRMRFIIYSLVGDILSALKKLHFDSSTFIYLMERKNKMSPCFQERKNFTPIQMFAILLVGANYLHDASSNIYLVKCYIL